MKHFINAREDIVTEAIDLEVRLSSGALKRIEGTNVVVRADWDRSSRSRVAVVSGGGSGHEPAHAGFVGDGMLTAAVCGQIFASPSVDAVLAAILAVTGTAGCLLVVKNYTGDRLNFGLAAEKARALGLAVEMIVVGDDVAVPSSRRGIAGTLFVHKVAGHAARAGAALAEVKAMAEKVKPVSIGVALSSCNVPGQRTENRIGPNDMELGLGIHGEPGAKLVPLGSVRELAKTMVDALGIGALGAEGPIALLVNDLGGVPPIEMAVATEGVLAAAKDVKHVFGPARLMTSLDMKGLSISALSVGDSAIEAALLSPVGPRAWPAARTPSAVATLPNQVKVAETEPSGHPERRHMLGAMCGALLENADVLDAADAKVGDGDTGSTLASAARAIMVDFDRLPFADAKALCSALSDRLARTTGGSMGVLLAIFTAAVGAKVDELGWRGALHEGVKRMQEYGGAKLGDRTMLDALIPALEATDPIAAAEAAARGADRTSEMTKANAGRSAYVRGDALLGTPDPGAIAVACVFQALAATPG